MIKPASLWALFKSCEDSKWLGDLCRTLGGQKGIALDFGQRQVLQMVRQDNEWMDERIESERDRHRKAVQRYRQRERGKASKAEEIAKAENPLPAQPCIVGPADPNSSAPVHATASPSKEELDAALASAPAPAPLEWFLKFRSTNATRLYVLGRNVTEEEVRSWYEFQQREGGWRYQNAAGTPITIRNFTGSLRKHAERLRKEAESCAAKQGFNRSLLDAHCAAANAKSPGSIAPSEVDAFWESLVRSGFTAKDGSRITKDNFAYYLSLAVRFSRGSCGAPSAQQEEWERRGFSSPDEMRDEIRLARQLLSSGAISEKEYRERIGESPPVDAEK